MYLTYHYWYWLIPVLDGTFRTPPLQSDCWKGKLVNPQTTKLLELPVEKGHFKLFGKVVFFPFPVSPWAVCLPLLLQCLICTKWGFKRLFMVKIRREARRLPVPRLFHQECEECPQLCGPHLLSRLNNKNGAMLKKGKQKLFKENICVLRFYDMTYSPRQTIIRYTLQMQYDDYSARPGGEIGPRFRQLTSVLGITASGFSWPSRILQPRWFFGSRSCGDSLFSTFPQSSLCHILSGSWILEPAKG